MAEVLLTVDDAVAVLTLNAPDRRNAFSIDMATDFVSACRSIDADDSIAVTIVRGEGVDFCSGAELSALQAVGTDPFADESYAGLRTIYDAFVAFGSLRTPTIAAVHGGAVGAGLNLALAADLRLVAHDAKLLSGFLRIGAHPGGGHFHLLTQLVGKDTATALAIFGEQLSGDDAVTHGLAWRAVPADALTELALTYARRISRDPELARAAIRSWRTESGTLADWTAAVDIERLPQMRSLYRRSRGQD
jgi:enoyl-CoA hydratase